MRTAAEDLKARARADAGKQRQAEAEAVRPDKAARRRLAAAEDAGQAGTFSDRETVADADAIAAGVKLREREAAADRIVVGAVLARERPLNEAEAAEVAAAREILAEAVARADGQGNGRAARRWRQVLETPEALPVPRWDAEAVGKLTEQAARLAADRFNGRNRAGWTRSTREERAEELAGRLALQWIGAAPVLTNDAPTLTGRPADVLAMIARWERRPVALARAAGQDTRLPLRGNDWKGTRAWLAARAEGWLKREAAALAEDAGQAEDADPAEAVLATAAEAVATGDALAEDVIGALAETTSPARKAEAEGIRQALTIRPDGKPLTHRERAMLTGETLAVVKNRAARGRTALRARWPDVAALRADFRLASAARGRDALAEAAEVQALPPGFILRVERAEAEAADRVSLAAERPNRAEALPEALTGAGPRRWNRAAAARRRVARAPVPPALAGPALMPWQGFQWAAEADPEPDKVARAAEASRRALARWADRPDDREPGTLARLRAEALAEVTREGLRAERPPLSCYRRPVPTAVAALPDHPPLTLPRLPGPDPLRVRTPTRGGRPVSRRYGPPWQAPRMPWQDPARNPHPAGHGRLQAPDPQGCGPVAEAPAWPGILTPAARTVPVPRKVTPTPTPEVAAAVRARIAAWAA